MLAEIEAAIAMIVADDASEMMHSMRMMIGSQHSSVMRIQALILVAVVGAEAVVVTIGDVMIEGVMTAIVARDAEVVNESHVSR
jgi:hypothetical protein